MILIISRDSGLPEGKLIYVKAMPKLTAFSF